MARGRGAKQFFNFNKGWITEASPMTFPENAAKDLENVILDVDGSIRRRPGVDFEAAFAKFGLAEEPVTVQANAITFNRWTNVAGSGGVNFTVAQFGTTLHFHRIDGDQTSASSVGTVDMTSFVKNIQEAPKSIVQVTSGLGFLFVTGRYIDPFYVEYDGTNLTANAINIQIRDFEGTDDNLLTDERPQILTTDHLYNLFNQGWPIDRINIYADITAVSGSIGDSVTIDSDVPGPLGAFPSNADIQYLGTKVDGSGDLVFDIAELNAQTFGNTQAPQGHFIIDAFAQDRDDISGISLVGTTTIPTRPETVAFHNGRVFFSGLFAQGVTGNVYFSQQLTDISKAGKCFQEQDPTAETFNDLLATDGGVIPIPNAGRILKIEEGHDGIVVFAANGVWQITGSDGKFSATNLAVTKITDVGCIGAETVVVADDIMLYWSDAGIIALQPDQISGQLNDANLSKNTIQIGYLLIGGLQRMFGRGTFISEEKKVVWLYSTDTAFDGITNRFKYNGVLVFDTQLGAFYKYLIQDTAQTVPYVAGIVPTVPFTTGTITENVTVGGVTVTVSAVDVTVSSEGATGVDITSWKLLTTIDSDTASKVDFTMGEFYSRSFKDWFKKDGIGIEPAAFLETGYELAGNAMVDKQPVYVFSYFSPLSKSLSTGGYYELPPLIVFSNGFRATQVVEENLMQIPSNLRTTQVVEEMLFTPNTSNLRTTQAVQEVLIEVV